ncbi:MAG: helix-turn-helix domain-containing protein [Chloroflexota bacterium]
MNTNSHNGSKSVADREKLFRVWQSTQNISKACRESGLSRSTFYYWHRRFQEGGFPALAEERSRAPKNPRRIEPELETLIVELRNNNPNWGKSRITRVIKERQPHASVSPNTVRRVLHDAGMWQGR